MPLNAPAKLSRRSSLFQTAEVFAEIFAGWRQGFAAVAARKSRPRSSSRRAGRIPELRQVIERSESCEAIALRVGGAGILSKQTCT